jgi:hypothetical protein
MGQRGGLVSSGAFAAEIGLALHKAKKTFKAKAAPLGWLTQNFWAAELMYHPTR